MCKPNNIWFWHYSDFTRALRRLKSPTTWLFVRQLVQDYGTLLALCEGSSSVTGGFPSQRASNADSDSMAWRHDGEVACSSVLFTSNTLRCVSWHDWLPLGAFNIATQICKCLVWTSEIKVMSVVSYSTRYTFFMQQTNHYRKISNISAPS